MTNESIHQQYVSQFVSALINCYYAHDVHPSAMVKVFNGPKFILDIIFTKNKISCSYICRYVMAITVVWSTINKQLRESCS